MYVQYDRCSIQFQGENAHWSLKPNLCQILSMLIEAQLEVSSEASRKI